LVIKGAVQPKNKLKKGQCLFPELLLWNTNREILIVASYTIAESRV